MSKRQKRTIAIDFDGVLHRYQGYRDGFIDGPIRGAREAVAGLVRAGHEVVVFTTRDAALVEAWLAQWSFPPLEVTNVKRPFWLILDDRAMAFNGRWDGVLEKIESFKPYWVDGNPAEAES